MIRDKLIPLLEQRFGANSFHRDIAPNLIVSFPPAYAEVGELKIFQYGNELIAEIGEIAHSHFDNLNPEATQEEAEQEIAETVLNFIEDLFAGKYILWRSKEGDAGGLKYIDFISEDENLSRFENDIIRFTWSGPLESDTQ